MESWEDGNRILKEANKKTEKYRKEVSKIMNSNQLTESDYKKIKELLEKESTIRNEALEKVEKIHRAKTENIDQQVENDESD